MSAVEEIYAAAKALRENDRKGPERNCWDTESGEEKPGAAKFPSDWAWRTFWRRRRWHLARLDHAIARCEGKERDEQAGCVFCGNPESAHPVQFVCESFKDALKMELSECD